MTVSRDPESHAQKTTVSEIPVVELKSPGSEDAIADQVIEGMKLAGVCIVRNLLSRTDVEKVRQELDPYVPQATSFRGFPTDGCQMSGLLSKSATYAHRIVGNKLFTTVRDHFLTSTYSCWTEQGTWMTVHNPPQLDATLAFYVNPGSPGQPLHRDDTVQQNWNTAASEYSLGRDTGCVLFVALTDSAREHGTTRFIPGSHLWDYKQDYPDDDDPRVRYAEMRPGDAYILLSSVTHASSINTSVDHQRILAAVFASRGHLHQAENQYLTYDIDTVRGFPRWLQRFMGYTISKPFLGWVDKKDPLLVVNPEAEEDDEDGNMGLGKKTDDA